MKRLLKLVLVLGLLAAISAVALSPEIRGRLESWARETYERATAPSPEQVQSERAQMLLQYCAKPGFGADIVAPKVFGRATLRMFYIQLKQVVFSLPVMSDEEATACVQGFVQHPEMIQWATPREGMLGFPGIDYQWYHKPERGLDRLGMFKQDDLKIDLAMTFERAYGPVTYSISVAELYAGFSGESMLKVPSGFFPRQFDTRVYSSYYAAQVAVRGEPSMTRLIAALLAGRESETREQRLQRVLNFVTAIPYRESVRREGHETLKRAWETLLIGEGDCNEKAVLLCSLLEQLGEEFLLLHMGDHMSVAVRRGAFPVAQKTVDCFRWASDEWVFLESTCSGYHIGISELDTPLRAANVEFIEQPRLGKVFRPDGTEPRMVN